MRNVTFAVTQFACSTDKHANADKAEQLVRAAAAAGAQVILLQELFEGLYWCQEQDAAFLSWAAPVENNPLIARFAALAKELGVVLPVPFYERSNNAYFNSVAVVDADGAVLGVYRKSHIPDGPGYNEKFYFSPGDTGFRVFDTRFGRLGIAICWDQWFPEAARVLAVKGAEFILYPTAIGTEPQDASLYSYPHWVRTQAGHAAANMLPVLASNRIGIETTPSGGSSITFHGGSFIAGPTGGVVAQIGAGEDALKDGNFDHRPAQNEGFTTATFDLDSLAANRHAWGVFRDRRPQLYAALGTLDGGAGFGAGGFGGPRVGFSGSALASLPAHRHRYRMGAAGSRSAQLPHLSAAGCPPTAAASWSVADGAACRRGSSAARRTGGRGAAVWGPSRQLLCCGPLL